MYKVLIVDDDENNRAVIYDTLEDENYELSEAADGNEAIAKIKEDMPDLVLLDIMMPGIDGLIALKEIKASERTQHIKVLMLTALNTETQIAECLNEGAMDYVTKPFSNMVLRAKVRAALRASSHSATTQPASAPQSLAERGRVVSFVGVKGGVGTTTAALNVATSLAADGTKVNFCELRPDSATATLQMRLRSSVTFEPLLDDDPGMIAENDVKSLLTRHPGGLRVLLGPGTNGKSRDISPEHADAIVERLAHLAELTVLDVPPFPTSIARAAVRRSDYVVLVCELEPLSWEASKTMLAKLSSWEIPYNMVGMVVNSRAQVSSPLNLADIRASLDCDLIGVIPPDPDECQAALKAGVPIVLYQADNIVAESLKSLGQRVGTAEVKALAF